MQGDARINQATRKDTFEGAELSAQTKKAREQKMKNAKEFECQDGDDGLFNISSSITVIEGKAPRKKKRR